MINLRLVIRQGPQAGQVIELQQPVLNIGRSKENDLPVDDVQVSRHHARLTRGEAGYALEDLGSTNGTFVNDRRLRQPATIQAGDVIRLGATVLMDVQALGVGQAVAPSRSSLTPPPPAARVYTPPPPPPVAFEPEPGHTMRNIAIGCGLLLAMVVCVLVAGFLVYQFAPPELAGPLCDALRPLPGVGSVCP